MENKSQFTAIVLGLISHACSHFGWNWDCFFVTCSCSSKAVWVEISSGTDKRDSYNRHWRHIIERSCDVNGISRAIQEGFLTALPSTSSLLHNISPSSPHRKNPSVRWCSHLQFLVRTFIPTLPFETLAHRQWGSNVCVASRYPASWAWPLMRQKKQPASTKTYEFTLSYRF